ncbi:WW domain protein [Kalmanozyma brasiliensis GHG001]|uniref:WW domain-containing protein n=1 Tax=Kalmanozyma brasiliensis (strain GHG001) TaxID=1365824 RepID=V5GFX7_KALBG|nr:WW domain protein [Kalmanozyma brasiliensis GHG001]EST04927.1 WW domain protein [Kalmanozyma brasiliensis GHG001]
MLPPHEVATDETIFRPDGFIKFPRSDGDPDYGPPNTVVPAKTDVEVNYYHVFGREEKRHDQWRTAFGEHLATYFKLDPLSRSKAKWKLYDFPEHYYFTEQRKGPALEPRTDPYLFGSQGHRFRSTKEAVEHFVWLLCDPDLNKANCRCKYCHKGPRTSTGGDATPKKTAGTKRKGEPMSASSAAGKVGRPRKSQNGDGTEPVQSQTSITIRGLDMKRLVPGLTIASVPQREQELMHELKRGEKERFRVGEMVWCRLEQPVVDPTDSSRQIAQWPAVIVDPGVEFTIQLGYDPEDKKDVKTSIEAVSAPSQRAESPPSLGGSSSSVQQSMVYQVAFFGTMETVRAPESALTPYLAGLIPHELINSDLGAREDHPWLFDENEFPHLNLSRQPDLPEPNFTKAIVAFGFAAEAVAVLRNLYSLTDAYSASDEPEQVLRDLGAAPTDEKKPADMRYYQGIYFGLERLWVGDVVRLRLSKSDIRKLQEQLNATLVADKLPGAPDPSALILDPDASYVLQLAAIYSDPRAPKMVRVAGEIFQIMPQAKYNALQADMQASIKRLEADDSLDAAARLEEAKQLEARLPKPSILTGKPGFPAMPPLPPGFVMISLSERLQTRIPRETTLSIGHVAGRIYPSLGMHSDGPRVAEQIQQTPADKRLAADEDTQIDLRARLSVAGLLSGCVKAMRGSSVHTWTRTASFRGALVIARTKLGKVILGEFDASDVEDSVSVSPSKTPSKKGKAAAAAAAELAAAATETPVQADTAAAGAEATNGAATQSQQTPVTTVETSPQDVAAATGGVAGDAPPSSEDEPPLLPGWVPRQSKTMGGWYFVHTQTKQTQWERPAA